MTSCALKLLALGKSHTHALADRVIIFAFESQHVGRRASIRSSIGLLAPAYGWFTEGFDTRDLKEAKALLEELAA